MSNNSTIKDKINNPKNPKKEIANSLLKTFEEKAKSLGIESIGYAKLPEDIFNSFKTLKYPNAIVFTIPINIPEDDSSKYVSKDQTSIDVSKDDFSLAEYLENVPPSDKAIELLDEYFGFGDLTHGLSDFLRKKGFATHVLHPAEEVLNLSILGQIAGLGYIGKNGLLISPELGPRLKVSGILTSIENLPFSEKNPHKWIGDYCKTCDKCIEGCLERALVEREDYSAKGKSFVEKCLIGSHKGCTSCIELCPFFENGYDWVKENK